MVPLGKEEYPWKILVKIDPAKSWPDLSGNKGYLHPFYRERPFSTPVLWTRRSMNGIKQKTGQSV